MDHSVSSFHVTMPLTSQEINSNLYRCEHSQEHEGNGYD